MSDTEDIKVKLLEPSDPSSADKPSSDDSKKDQTPTWVLIVMLLFIMHLTFGSYWVFDTPGAIQKQLQAYLDPGVAPTDSWYTDGLNLWLYSIYSYPNIVLAFFGGYIVDAITGLRAGTLLFCGLVLLGQLVFALGIQMVGSTGGKTGYAVMMIGRLIFGLGGESLTVAQNNYCVKYFKGPYIALAFGMVVSYSRVGSSVNFVVTPALGNISVPLAVWVGTAFCGMSFLFAVLAGLLDTSLDKKAKKAQEASTEEPPPEEPPVRLRDVGKFTVSVWLLYLITLTFYVAILTFYTIASQIMQNTKSIADKLPGTTDDDKAYWATFLLSFPNFVAIVAAPACGRMVDKVGKSLYLVAIASIMFVCGHLMFLAFALEWIVLPEENSMLYLGLVMVWLGTAYSLGAACLWPMLALMVPESMVATGYGAMTAVQNAGLALFPQLIGFLTGLDGIKGTTWQYTVPIIIFISVAGVAFCLTLLLMAVDNTRTGGRLNMNAEQRKVHDEGQKSAVTHDGWPVAQHSNDSLGKTMPVGIHVNNSTDRSLNASTSASFEKQKGGSVPKRPGSYDRNSPH